jgi:type II secretory pathway pseudopilin PulG
MASKHAFAEEQLTPEEQYAQTISEMRQLGVALGSHQVDLNYFPICPSEKDVSEVELGKSDWAAPSWDDYYDGDFKDAWGTPFKYVSTDDGQSYTLTSYGADEAKGDGGGKFDADIVYSNGMFVTPVIEVEIEESEPEPEPKTPQEKFDRTVEDMRSLGTPIESYLIDFNHFPLCPSEKDLSETGMGEMYHGDMVKDAWGMPFKYVSTDDGNEFTLTSYGADKAKGDGGGEFDADIVYRGKYDPAARSVEKGFIAPPSLVQE